MATTKTATTKKMNVKRRQKPKFKIRFEWILWITVTLMGLMLLSVNFVLLKDNNDNDNNNNNNINNNNINDNIDDDDDEDPILKLLKLAHIKVTPERRTKLPTWQQVIDRFGSEAKIIGVDTCQRYRDTVPIEQRSVAPAGPFNSGTNLLQDVLQKNCHIPGTKRDHSGILWQVNWGKHQPPKFRLENYVRKHLNNTAFMPIVPLRDPYSWMQSMCKNMYAARWNHDLKHCPNIVPKNNSPERTFYDNQKQRLQKELLEKSDNNLTLEEDTIPVHVDYNSATIYHQSLAHMWKDWYQEYYDATFPRLMVRLEDIVFHPEQVLRQICDCVGGEFALSSKKKKDGKSGGGGKLSLQGSAAKQGDGHGANPSDLTSAMVKHVFSNRTKGMTVEDLEYAARILSADTDSGGPSLMDLFGYSHPV